MICFNHNAKPAVGSCRACCKGLCAECAVDLGQGLACRDACETDVTETIEMNERSKKIYGIGKYRTNMPPSGVLMWGTLSLLLWGVVAFVFFRIGTFNVELAIPAGFFTIITGFAFYSSKRSGINC